MPPHPLTNFEIKEYYENEASFNGVYSRENLPKGSSIKDVCKNLGIFGTPFPLSRPVHIWLTTPHPSPCSCRHKAGII